MIQCVYIPVYNFVTSLHVQALNTLVEVGNELTYSSVIMTNKAQKYTGHKTHSLEKEDNRGG